MNDKRDPGYTIAGRSEVYATLEDAADVLTKLNLTGPLQTNDVGWYQRIYEEANSHSSKRKAIYEKYDCYISVLVIAGICVIWIITGSLGVIGTVIDSSKARAGIVALSAISLLLFFMSYILIDVKTCKPNLMS